MGDEWWTAKQNRLKEHCIALEMDRESFLQSVRSKSWKEVAVDLEQLVASSGNRSNRGRSNDNNNDDSKVADGNNNGDHEDNDVDFVYDMESLVILVRLCTENDLFGPQTFGRWLLNLLEDEEEFNRRMASARKYIVDDDDVNAQKLTDNK